ASDFSTADDAEVARELAARPELPLLRPGERARLAADLWAAVAMLGEELRAGLEIVGREVPFVLPLPRRQPRVFLQGRIDVLGRRGGVPLVRDYKYATPSDAAVAGDADQLAAYRLAVAAHPAGGAVFPRGRAGGPAAA